MTTEQDDKPRRRPPTIDLTATEIAADAKDAAEAAAESAAPNEPVAARSDAQSSAGGLWHYATGAGVGAVLVLLIGAGLWAAGLVPSRDGTAAAPSAPTANAQALDALTERMAKVEMALAAPRTDPANAARMAAAEAETKSLADTVAALARRIDDAVSAARDARTRADAAQSAAADADQKAARAGQNRVELSDLEALATRIAALEKSNKAIADELARQKSSGGDRAARLVVTAEALRAGVERGDPYEAELTALKSLGADQAALSALAPFAATGVPGNAALAHELAARTTALRQAIGAPASAGGFLDRLQANAEKLVRIRPIDAPPGDDLAAIVTRIDLAATRGDIAGALAEIAKLPADARAEAAPWVKKVEARNAAIAAARRLSADALAALGKPGAQ